MLETKQIDTGIPIEVTPIFAIVAGHLCVYTFPKGIEDTFLEVLGIKDKKELIRRVSTHEEVGAAISRGLIPMNDSV